MQRFHVMSSEYGEIWYLDCLAADEQGAIAKLREAFPGQRFCKPLAIDIDTNTLLDHDLLHRFQEKWKDGRKAYLPELSSWA